MFDPRLFDVNALLVEKCWDTSDAPGILLQENGEWKHRALTRLQGLLSIKLARCEVNSEQLGNFLGVAPQTLKKLDLSENPGIFSDMFWPSWRSLKVLAEIKICRCDITSGELEALVDAMPVTVKLLDLSDNPGILPPQEPLSWRRLWVLEEVRLVRCSVTTEQLQVFVSALSVSVKRLDLSENSGVISQSEAAPWQRLEALEEIRLKSCDVTRDQLSMLVNAMPVSMKRFDLSGNVDVVSDQVAPFWQRLESLERVSLARCDVGPNQFGVLVVSLPEALKFLDMSNNPGILSHKDASLWPRLSSLSELRLVACEVSPEELEVLVASVSPTVRNLDLSENSGILAKAAVPCWSRLEVLEELTLRQCDANRHQLSVFPCRLPASLDVIVLDPYTMVRDSALEAFNQAGFKKNASLPGSWHRHSAPKEVAPYEPEKPPPMSHPTEYGHGPGHGHGHGHGGDLCSVC